MVSTSLFRWFTDEAPATLEHLTWKEKRRVVGMENFISLGQSEIVLPHPEPLDRTIMTSLLGWRIRISLLKQQYQIMMRIRVAYRHSVNGTYLGLSIFGEKDSGVI